MSGNSYSVNEIKETKYVGTRTMNKIFFSDLRAQIIISLEATIVT